MSKPAAKTFHLPLLAALPALLASCGDSDDLGRYSRVRYNSYQECMAVNGQYVQQGMANPCVRTSSGTGGFFFYGPFMRVIGNSTRVVGYNSAGTPLSTGLSYDAKKGTYGSFKTPVNRGGLTGGSRASRGSFGG